MLVFIMVASSCYDAVAAGLQQPAQYTPKGGVGYETFDESIVEDENIRYLDYALMVTVFVSLIVIMLVQLLLLFYLGQASRYLGAGMVSDSITSAGSTDSRLVSYRAIVFRTLGTLPASLVFSFIAVSVILPILCFILDIITDDTCSDDSDGAAITYNVKCTSACSSSTPEIPGVPPESVADTSNRWVYYGLFFAISVVGVAAVWYYYPDFFYQLFSNAFGLVASAPVQPMEFLQPVPATPFTPTAMPTPPAPPLSPVVDEPPLRFRWPFWFRHLNRVVRPDPYYPFTASTYPSSAEEEPEVVYLVEMNRVRAQLGLPAWNSFFRP